MVIDFTPSTKESEEARILKLKEDAVEAGIKAKEILNSIGIKYTSRIYNRLLLNILYVINQKYGLNL